MKDTCHSFVIHTLWLTTMLGTFLGKGKTGDIFEYTSVVHSLSTSHPLVHSGGVLEDMCMCYNLGHTLQQWSYKFWP